MKDTSEERLDDATKLGHEGEPSLKNENVPLAFSESNSGKFVIILCLIERSNTMK